jgi:hypothetical protein
MRKRSPQRRMSAPRFFSIGLAATVALWTSATLAEMMKPYRNSTTSTTSDTGPRVFAISGREQSQKQDSCAYAKHNAHSKRDAHPKRNTHPDVRGNPDAELDAYAVSDAESGTLIG